MFYLKKKKTKLTLHYAFFYSYLSYCFLLWGNTTTSNIQKLLIFKKKKMLRDITKAPYNSPTGQAYVQFKIVPVYNLFEYRFACFYKNIIAKIIIFFHLLFLFYYNTPYATREKETFVLPRCRTNYGFTMLRYIFPKFLNTPLCDHLSDMSSAVLRNTFL
ncbi:unnamed protein product [Ixodes persulcatus]